MDCQKQVICFWPSNLSKDVNTHFHTLTIFDKTITKKDRKVLLWNQKSIWCDNVSSIQLSLKNEAKWYNFVDNFHWTQVFHGPSILVRLSQNKSLQWGTTFGESTKVCFHCYQLSEIHTVWSQVPPKHMSYKIYHIFLVDQNKRSSMIQSDCDFLYKGDQVFDPEPPLWIFVLMA